MIEGINQYFPNEIKQKIQNIINYLLKNEENDIYYNHIYDLIFNLYNIFINKSKEIIENNKGKINCSKVSQESINKKINELQKEYYLNIKDIKPPENKDNNYLKILETKILQKINEIDKNKNEIKDLENNNIIISNKLLILGNEVTSIDKIEQNKIKKNNENENKVIESTAIEIEEIIIEEKISINSMMEFFDNCISKTRILPIFIKISVINKDEKNIEKAKNIFNKLFAIYKEVKEKKYSLFSNKTNEFIKYFKIMFNKLINTNVGFKKDNILCKLKNELKEDISLTEYIIIPEKEKFNIKQDYFIIHRNDLDSLFNNQNYNKNDFDTYNEYDINITLQENKMDIEYSDIAYNEDQNDDNNESMINNENQNEKKNSYIEEQVQREIIKALKNYDNKMEENKLIENNEEEKDLNNDIEKKKCFLESNRE